MHASASSTSVKTVVLNGYYGFNNYGDELILQSLIQHLQRRGVQVVVLSKDPEATAQRYNVQAIHRYKLLDVLRTLQHADVFISGGGGLFQDTTGWASPVYYGGMILLAKRLGLKVAHAFQSLGPLTTPLGRLFTRNALNNTDLILVRDSNSANLVHQLTGKTAMVTADAVWLLEAPPKESIHPQQETPLRLGLSLRPHPQFTLEAQDALFKQVHYFLQTVQKQGQSVELTLLSCQSEMDDAVLQAFADRLKQSGCLEPFQVRLATPNELSTAIAQCDYVIGMRYHSLVSALLHQVPVFALDYDPKVTALISDLKLTGCAITHLENAPESQLVDAYQQRSLPSLASFKAQVATGVNALDALLFQDNLTHWKPLAVGE